MDLQSFQAALASRRALLVRHLEERPTSGLSSGPLLDGVLEYVRRGGKYLRGTACLLSCGLLGGRESLALPAAAAIEVFHAWTLAHDDIVDRDNVRRGGPTLHRYFERQARQGHDAPWYGISLSLLAGDIQQAWATELLTRLEAPPALIVAIVRELAGTAIPQLVAGEVLDIELSGTPFSELRQPDILEMIDKKTAVLYRFAGKVGAWLALGSSQPTQALELLDRFYTGLGIAFQLKDDCLGVSSSTEKLGKDANSDLREGKRTLIAALAYQRSSQTQQRLLDSTLGNLQATAEQLEEVRACFHSCGAVQEVEALAHAHVRAALDSLNALPARPERDLLEQLALFLLSRES